MPTDLIEDVHGVGCLSWNPDRDGRRVSNFGDLLGPRIVERLVHRSFTAPESGFTGHLLSVGSVLHFAQAGDVVWGAGVNGKVPPALPARLDIRAVRGPFTRCAVLGAGHRVPEVSGDPALLAARLWPGLRPAPDAPRRPAIAVPNLHEIDRFRDDVTVSPIGDPLEVIREVAASEFVTGTSLHGLILADAFGVPSRPVRSEVEHPFKYVDYYASTGRFNVEFASSFEHALELGPLPPPRIDLDALERAFPTDLWTEGGNVAPARVASIGTSTGTSPSTDPEHPDPDQAGHTEQSDQAEQRDGTDEAERAAQHLRRRIGRPTPEEAAALDLLETLRRDATAPSPAS